VMVVVAVQTRLKAGWAASSGASAAGAS
jgi:hypothetical protein